MFEHWVIKVNSKINFKPFERPEGSAFIVLFYGDVALNTE